MTLRRGKWPSGRLGGWPPGRVGKVAAALGTMVAVVAITVLPAFGNAANPTPPSVGSGVVSGTVLTNQDGSILVKTGTVAVKVNGTWNWTSQTGCSSRFGVGWAVDWFGVSSTAIPNTFGWPIKNTTLLFHVTTTMDGVEGFTNPCKAVDSGGHPIGTWSATHTYKAGETIPANLCVNMYDLHGTPGALSKQSDLDPTANGDNSVKTNSFNPTVGDGFCFKPTLTNASQLVTTATDATLGGNITDSAALSGTVNATGKITFTVFSDAACTKSAAPSTDFTVNGNGTYGPATFKPLTAGKYFWIASYSGDSNNDPLTGKCGDTGETSTVTESPSPDLGILKTGPSQVNVGDTIDYTITITNTGNVDVPNATWTDPLPADTTFLSVDSPCGTDSPPTKVTCNVGTLGAGKSFGPIHMKVTANKVGTVTNTASVPGDVTPTDDTSTVKTTVVAGPASDLSIKKTGPAQVNLGDTITYSITVTNTGNTTVQHATFTDPLPPNTGLITLGFGCSFAMGKITCDVGTLNPGDTSSPVVVVIFPLKVGTYVNTASVPTDGTPSDDSSTVTTIVGTTPVVDLGILKTGPSQVSLGDNITYNITITNTGNVDVPNATWTDPLPADTTFVSVDSPCTVDNPPTKVTCNVGTLGAGKSFGPLHLVVKTTKVGTVTNTASVPTDSTPSDDTSTVKTTVVAAPVTDLGILKTGPQTAGVGDNITYNITITNTGTIDVPNATWTDPLPANTTFVSVDSPCTVDNPPTKVTCNVGLLAVGKSFGPLHLVVKATKEGTVTNTASVPGDGTPGDDTSTVTTTVGAPFSVHVGYADNLHLVGAATVPSIWQGAPNTTFVGCNASLPGNPCTNASPVHDGETCPVVAGQNPADCYDSGALRLDNNTTNPIQLSSVTVTIGTCTWNPWAGQPQSVMTIPVGGSLILTQTGGIGPNVACGLGPDPEAGFNFDTSDARNINDQSCVVSNLIPKIDVTLTGGGTLSFFDKGQVLNTAGIDPSCIVFDQNEGHDWSGAL